jgi:hypothetical protein
LYFPLIYVFALITHHIHGVDFQNIYLGYGFLTIILWQVFLTIYILRSSIYTVERTLRNFAYALIPFAIFVILIMIVRDYGSIISTDILGHQTVLNGMENPNNIGFMPATYSTTFTGQGYPIIMYHTFLYMLSNAFSFPYHLVGYFVDILLTLMCSLVLFKFFLKYFGSFWAVIGTALAILTFENLAYTAHFFIPQTFAVLLFLIILGNKSLNLSKVLIASIILIVTHFLIGPFLAIFLLIKYFYFEKKLLNKDNQNHNFLFMESFLLFSFIILLNAAGFSIERYFQKATTGWFGNLSNPEFFNKLPVLFNLLGAIWILLIPALVRILLKKKREMPELIGYFGILLTLSIYFLSPTFASKFFLGFGFFASLVIISWFRNINFVTKYFKITILSVIILAYMFNFSTQFLELTRFLEQENGQRTALVSKDDNLIAFWRKENPECVLISDPQTQLIIHSIGKGTTARGMYMTLESRKKLADFVREPSQEALIKVLEIEELENIKSDKICLGISQRLIEMAEKNQIWEELISTYQVDHKNAYLETSHPSIKLLDIYPRIYLDGYHAVFLVRGIK